MRNFIILSTIVHQIDDNVDLNLLQKQFDYLHIITTTTTAAEAFVNIIDFMNFVNWVIVLDLDYFSASTSSH